MSDKIYTRTRLKDEISISEIVTIHYFEFSKDYKFSGESHDCWELVYVDKGKIILYNHIRIIYPYILF